MSERDAKKHLRAALRADPDSFERLIREYMDQGATAFDAPNPGENAGRPGRMNFHTWAMFLARTLNLIEDQGSQNKALNCIEENADFWQNPQTGDYGTIENANTAKRHLAKARQRYEDDETFREYVDWYRRAMRDLGH